MKVLHINAGEEDGGGLTHIISLLSQFKAHEVTLLTFIDGPVAKTAREQGISVLVMPQSSRYDLAFMKRLVTYIKEEQFDIVHTHGPRANFYGQLIRHRIPAHWVITVHSDPRFDFINGGIIGRLFSWLNIRALKKATALFAVTNNFKNVLVELGVNSDKIQVIYNGIEFTSAPAIRQPHTTFNLIYVARLHPIKNHVLLIKALKQTGLTDTQLTFVGEGAERPAIEAAIEAADLQQQITLVGFKKQAQIHEQYATTDLAVLSSDSESFPLVLLEAANEHRPVIATDVGDMHVMLPNDSLGFIVPVGDVTRFSAAILAAHALWEKQELTAMGDRFYTYAAQHFSIENLYLSIINGYQTLLTNAGRKNH